jgi:hypothetical protein
MEANKKGIIIAIASVAVVGLLCLCAVAVLSVFALSSSARPRQPGVYIQQGRRFDNLERYRGAPDRDASTGIPSISNYRPTLILWDSTINFNYLELHRMSPRRKVEYATKWSGELLEATPRNDLEAGRYCFIQGDPVGIPGTLAHWCFEVE